MSATEKSNAIKVKDNRPFLYHVSFRPGCSVGYRNNTIIDGYKVIKNVDVVQFDKIYPAKHVCVSSHHSLLTKHGDCHSWGKNALYNFLGGRIENYYLVESAEKGTALKLPFNASEKVDVDYHKHRSELFEAERKKKAADDEFISRMKPQIEAFATSENKELSKHAKYVLGLRRNRFVKKSWKLYLRAKNGAFGHVDIFFKPIETSQ